FRFGQLLSPGSCLSFAFDWKLLQFHACCLNRRCIECDMKYSCRLRRIRDEMPLQYGLQHCPPQFRGTAENPSVNYIARTVQVHFRGDRAVYAFRDCCSWVFDRRAMNYGGSAE